VSPDGKFIAMVCRRGQLRAADLALAALDLTAASIGPAATLVSGKLVASPSFSRDGLSLAYLAPTSTGGQFQLWTIASKAAGNPGAPVQVTQNLGFDSDSAPVWLGP
jgi:Tol biopolymer transport system component